MSDINTNQPSGNSDNTSQPVAKKKSGMRKVFLFLLTCAVLALLAVYFVIYAPNTTVSQKTPFYIHTGSKYQDVLNTLESKGLIRSMTTFKIVARRMNYPKHIKPGKYMLLPGMGNHRLLQMLRSGKQEPVVLVFNNIRTKQEFASRISLQLEADSVSLLNDLNNNAFMKKYGLNKENALTLFIPNSYQLWWNTTPDEFFERMAKENKHFWNKERLDKAAAIKLKPAQVVILASIVEKESNKNDEKPVIAGVYLNRLKKGMLLQADPTLVFAWNDFTIHRVLNVHKNINSPYNTYKYKGLPPGPIYLPDSKSIDAVLNFTHHNYLYFCAKEDFSGYHNFASTPEAHHINAEKYQKALDAHNIKK
ncbi:MAG: endolytic transglycosylase MltG [Bacteroidota bacterium]|nr:endolytic transglycosylase MltG [Bacteroidota bacterium]